MTDLPDVGGLDRGFATAARATEQASLGVVASIRAVTREAESAADAAGRSGQAIGGALTRAFERAVVGGRSLSDTLRGLALDLSRVALRQALAPLQSALGTASGNLLTAFSGLFTGGAGGGASGAVSAFARGGVVGGPTAFPLASGIGVMGEQGAEAILPLALDSQGRLGVAASGGGMAITVNIATPDVAGFHRSLPQIEAALARSAARGRRGL